MSSKNQIRTVGVARYRFGCLALLVLWTTTLANATALRATGTVRFRSFATDQTAVIDEVTHFEVKLNECEWWMRLELENDTSFDYHLVAFDGIDLRAVSPMERAIELKRQREEEVAGNNVAATLLRSAVPRLSFPHASAPIWLTFCSGCYFRSRTNGLAELPSALSAITQRTMDLTEALFPYKAEWLDHGSNFIASHVTYWGGAKTTGLEKVETNTCFAVIKTSQVAGQLFPSKSTFYCYSVGIKPARILYSYDLEVDDGLETKAFSIPKPGIPGRAIVSDYRFLRSSNGLSMTYWKSGDFPSDAEVFSMKGIDQRRMENGIDVPPKTPWRFVASIEFILRNPRFLILAGVLAIGCLWLLTRRRTGGFRRIEG